MGDEIKPPTSDANFAAASDAAKGKPAELGLEAALLAQSAKALDGDTLAAVLARTRGLDINSSDLHAALLERTHLATGGMKHSAKGSDLEAALLGYETRVARDEAIASAVASRTAYQKSLEAALAQNIAAHTAQESAVNKEVRRLMEQNKWISERSHSSRVVDDLWTGKVFGEWGSKLRERDKQLEQIQKELADFKKLAGQNEAKAVELDNLGRRLQEELEQKRRHIELSHLLTRVSPRAADKLLHDESFRSSFLTSPCPAYVLSIDIRRSTELMLKAREPSGFAEFLITLASALKRTILDNDGVFEKFTGDGILAYFPEHFSGKDAGYRALTAATVCHDVFADFYLANRSRFTSVIKNTGLGIGVDFGTVHTMVVSGEFAVVGTPVVYACKMAGANAGDTLLNQAAFEQIGLKYEQYFSITETEIEIKHEGPTVAYQVVRNGKSFVPELPQWSVLPATPELAKK